MSEDCGFVQVKLWYGEVDYGLRLGLLVSAWTPHVSNAEAGAVANRGGRALTMSLFPERDSSCWFLVREGGEDGGLCRTPVGYREGRPVDGLMTLKGFVEGGGEVADGKVLVAVKSIAARKKCGLFMQIPDDWLTRLGLLSIPYSYHEEGESSRESRRSCL